MSGCSMGDSKQIVCAQCQAMIAPCCDQWELHSGGMVLNHYFLEHHGHIPYYHYDGKQFTALE